MTDNNNNQTISKCDRTDAHMRKEHRSLALYIRNLCQHIHHQPTQNQGGKRHEKKRGKGCITNRTSKTKLEYSHQDTGKPEEKGMARENGKLGFYV